jgi:hypothetical protein
MVRQRWSEAGLNRRLAVLLLCAQAVLIVFTFVGFVLPFDNDVPGSLASSIILSITVSVIPLAVNGMVASLVLSGSPRGRVLATVLSSLTCLWWLFRGWVGLVIAILAIATIVVVWRQDQIAGAVGIRPAPPFD